MAGFPVKAQVGREEKLLSTLNDLDSLCRLKKEGVQNFDLFYDSIPHIPEDALETSLNEAIAMVCAGNTIYSQHDGEEISFSSSDSIISYYRSCMLHDGICKLYWKK